MLKRCESITRAAKKLRVPLVVIRVFADSQRFISKIKFLNAQRRFHLKGGDSSRNGLKNKQF